MKKILPPFLLVFFLFSLPCTAQRKGAPDAEKFFSTAMSQINPKHVAWIKSTAKTMNEKSMAASEANSFTAKYAKENVITNNRDINALVFLVLQQNTKNADDDLKKSLAEMEANENKKEALRRAQEKLKEKEKDLSRSQVDSFKLLVQDPTNIQKINSPVSALEIEELEKKIKDKLDSLTELGGRMELKSQWITERMIQSDKAATDLLKKFYESKDNIISNLK